MSDPVQTLLGFDYGERRIGVAVGQSLTGTATALATISVKEGGPDWDAIGSLMQTWRPDALIVGLPLNMDGTEQTMTNRARRFGRQLHGRFGLVVHWADERLSTREASQRLLAASQNPTLSSRPGTRSKGSTGPMRRPRGKQGPAAEGRDAIAAQVILEGWLAGRSADPNHHGVGAPLGDPPRRAMRTKDSDDRGC